MLSFRFLNPEGGTDRLPETSLRNYQHTLRNKPEERSSELSRKTVVCKPMAFVRFFNRLVVPGLTCYAGSVVGMIRR